MQHLSTGYVFGSATTTKALTNAYTGATSTAISVGGCERVNLDISYTMGAAETSNSIQMIVEYANTASNGDTPATADWHQSTNLVDSAGTTTITNQEYTFSATEAAATYDRINVVLDTLGNRWIRISLKETGVATNAGNVVVKATLAETGR